MNVNNEVGNVILDLPVMTGWVGRCEVKE
jgi:hypothetical protein